jgi:hypothetical protein
MLWISVLVFLSASLGFAGSWSGVLVDSKCYDRAEMNVNPWEPYHDQEMDVRMCRPNGKTKAFAVVQGDWRRLKLDAQANAEAAEVVRNAGGKRYLGVVVTGEMNKGEVKVTSIVAAR